jgi:hypothetical protein
MRGCCGQPTHPLPQHPQGAAASADLGPKDRHQEQVAHTRIGGHDTGRSSTA